MKKSLFFILIVTAGFGAFYYQRTSICRRPISYDVGSFDDRFDISKEEFLATIKKSEKIWEDGTGHDLFTYEPGGKLKINLVFDERQKATIEADKSIEQIEISRASYDSLLRQYKSLEASYQISFSAYNSRAAQFEQRLSDYNSRVAAINQKGGATPQEYKELEQERGFLEGLEAELERDRLALNSEASRLNSLGDDVNYMARKLNLNVDIHNQRYGEAREFDQGDYLNNRINIYQFETMSDLRLVLAHELGHAISLDHVENSESIMYYLMENQDMNNPSLSSEDKAAFQERCGLNLLGIRDIFN